MALWRALGLKLSMEGESSSQKEEDHGGVKKSGTLDLVGEGLSWSTDIRFIHYHCPHLSLPSTSLQNK